MAIDLTQAEQVGAALLQYLADRLEVPDLRFAEVPEQISHGWETYIYTFQLAGDGLPPAWSPPLILRIYPGILQDDRAEREAAVQRFVVERGFPAPRPLLVEPTARALGKPFMIMERVAGVPMLDRMVGKPIAAFHFAKTMADLHVALHRLPVDGCPLPCEGPLVERRFSEMWTAMAELGVEMPSEARPALAWLQANEHLVAEEPLSLCHHDFHPLNLLVDDAGKVTVIDWSAAAIGDRHSDVASTLVLVRTAPIQAEGVLERLLARFGRGLFAWLYLRRYRQQLAIERERLRYWEAMRAFEWWVMVAAVQSTDAAALGLKPDTAERVPADHVEHMRRYFWQRARR